MNAIITERVSALMNEEGMHPKRFVAFTDTLKNAGLETSGEYSLAVRALKIAAEFRLVEYDGVMKPVEKAEMTLEEQRWLQLCEMVVATTLENDATICGLRDVITKTQELIYGLVHLLGGPPV